MNSKIKKNRYQLDKKIINVKNYKYENYIYTGEINEVTKKKFILLDTGKEELTYEKTYKTPPNGNGTAISLKDGKILKGNWVDGKLTGFGSIIIPSYSTYIGEILNGDMHGNGKLTFHQNNDKKNKFHIFEGNWEKNIFDGKGKIIYSTGSVYEGEINIFKRHGKGIYTTSNGCTFNGTWTNDILKGECILSVDNRIIHCNWSGITHVGKCNIIYESGIIYEGYCSTDYLPNGQGKMTYLDGSVYDGEWVNGLRDGFGELRMANGQIYIGNWEKNKKNNNGTMFYPDNSFYNGNWENDQKNGYGIFQYSNKSYYKGYWNNGVKEGYGFLYMYHGDYYNGYWKNDLPHNSEDYGKIGIYYNKCYSVAINYVWDMGKQVGCKSSYYF